MTQQTPTPPVLALLVTCVECGEGVEVIFPIEQHALDTLLAVRGWYLSVLSPPQPPPQQSPVVIGAVCTNCAQRAFSPELLKASEARRQAILAAASQTEKK